METEKEINNAFYDDLKEKWYAADDHPIALLRAENATRTPWVIEQIKNHFDFSSCKILDIGCGAGFLANALAEKGHKVTGIDCSFQSLEVAKHKDTTQTATYIQADAYQLPFSKGEFDVVCAMDFLEHVDKPQAIIEQVSKVLKPGGLFFFHTFNRNPLSWLIVLKGVEWFVKNTPKNMHIYRLFLKPVELKDFCAASSLQVVTFQGLVPDIQKKAFWKMLMTRRVSQAFSFRLTSSLSCGYMGIAKKTPSSI